jgi:hypothetical protein
MHFGEAICLASAEPDSKKAAPSVSSVSSTQACLSFWRIPVFVPKVAGSWDHEESHAKYIDRLEPEEILVKQYDTASDTKR